MGIRDFIRHLKEHQERLERGQELSDAEREEILREAETMVGMADAAVKELESVIKNRRINLPEEHAVRFAQDVFPTSATKRRRSRSGSGPSSPDALTRAA
jgi:hypothetical protein